MLLYIERWLKAPVQMEDGSIMPRMAGTPQGGVISPLLANVFLHYAFDMWMVRTFPHIPFERYADDAICHCRSAEEARALWGAIADRFAACKLVLHPQKTKIVYCKDVNRRGDFPDIHFDFLGFKFRARKIMWVKPDGRIFSHSFQPAASPKALTRISREIRGWALHHRSDKSLTELAQMYNPCIRGWISYYGHFYKTQLRPTLERIDAYVIRWARRKFKRIRHQTKGARDWFDRVGSKKMKLLKGDSFPIFLVSDGVWQQSCRGHLSKEVARSSGCRRSVQRFRCSMAVFELLARATAAWVVAAGNGHLVNRSSRIADGVPRRSAAGKPVRMDVAGGWRYQVNQYLMSRVGVLVSLD